MKKRRLFMLFILTAVLKASATTLVTLYPVADADIRSFASVDNGYDRTALVVKHPGPDPSSSESAKAYVRFKLPDDFGAAVNASFTLTRSVAGAYNFVYDVSGLDDGVSNETDWVEANGSAGMCWNDAPGNILSSPHEFDSSASVGSFSVVGSNYGGSAGDSYSINGTNLTAFLNEDSNGYVTLMIGRPGQSSSSDQFCSRSCDAYDAPRLVLEYVRAPQDAVLSASGDATVRSDSPGSNFGSDSHLKWSYTSDNPYAGTKAYFRFQLPQGAPGNVLSATLRLTRSAVTAWYTEPKVYVLNEGAVGENWSESTINWTNAPANILTGCGFSATDSTLVAAERLSGYNYGGAVGDVWSISNGLVSVLNADTNHSVTFMVEWTSGDYHTGESFAATEHTTLSGPVLEISYTPENVEKSPVLATSADATVKSASPGNNFGLDDELQWGCSSDSPYVGLKNYFRFKLPSAAAGNITSAVLRLTRSAVGPWETYPNLYTLRDGASGQDWDELDIVWTNAPGNELNDYGFDTDLTTFITQGRLYGTQAGHTNGEAWAVSNGLVEVLNADTDQSVTFMVEWGGNPYYSGVAFASKEHVVMAPPVLELGYTTSSHEADLKTLATERWHAWRKSRTEFPAAAWSYFNNYSGTSSEYQQYRDAGLNMVQSPYAQCNNATSVDGLDLLLGSWESIWNDPVKLTQYLSYPSPDAPVAGYVLYDEPPVTNFPALAEATEMVYRYDDRNAIPIVDHLPNWAVSYDRFGLGDGDGSYYETYINKFVEDVSPCVMVNCHYPIKKDGTDRAGYYSNIEYFRSICLEQDIGLMGFALVTAHSFGTGTEIDYREPSESDLNWMVYSYLSYGAQGMFYWNYQIEPDDRFEEGMVAHSNGAPRATYYMVQDVNKELDNLWPVFQSLKSSAVYHVGVSVPTDTVQYANGYIRPIDAFTGTNCIISEFTNQDDLQDNSCYVMIVNKNHGMNLSSSETDATVEFTADADYPYVCMISPLTGEDILLQADSGGDYSLTLGGGKGILLKFMPRFPASTVVTPVIDTYVQQGNPGVDFDSGSVLIAQNSTAYTDRNRKVYMKFIVPENDSVTNAVFEVMPISIYNPDWVWNYNVHGLKQGAPGDDWVSITWTNAPANDSSSGYLFTTNATDVLCQIAGGGQAGVDREATSASLTEFIQNDSDGVITLMMVRSNNSSAHDTWGSCQSDDAPPPRLKLMY